MSVAPLTDSFGRAFQYLRLSVDEACNFRCVYCLPDGYKKSNDEPPLSADEVRRLVAAFSELGFWKVRLTGGEPTTRKDIVELAMIVSSTPGVRRTALSTNGYRLAELATDLAEAGLNAVNVSVDSLDKGRFAQITGRDELPSVLKGIDACLAAGIETKINVVLLKGYNEQDITSFLDYVNERPVAVRFIELMQTGDNGDFFKQHHLSGRTVLGILEQLGWREQTRKEGDGPARQFRREGAVGSAGLIAPYAADFCGTCNRLRVTSRGALRLCLFAEGQNSLRDLLQRDDQRAALQQRVRTLIGRKEVSHYLPQGLVGSTRHFALMGG